MKERSQPTEAERAAARWIARLEASDVTLDDHQRFRAWLAASEENRAAYEAMSATWDKLDLLNTMPLEGLPRPARAPASPRAAPGSDTSRRALLFGAGAAALVGGGAVALWALTPATTFAATYSAPVGGRSGATLSDGTIIALNAATEIDVRFSEQRRLVFIRSGEALFSVAAHATPFEIRTPFGDLRADGAEILVKVMSDGARATIFEGEVLGGRDGGVASSSKQEIVLGAGAPQVSPVSDEQTSARLAWRSGMLAFDGETLREACEDVERQTGVRFVFADPAIAEMRIGGYIDASDAAAFIALLESNLAVTATRSENEVLISAS